MVPEASAVVLCRVSLLARARPSSQKGLWHLGRTVHVGVGTGHADGCRRSNRRARVDRQFLFGGVCRTGRAFCLSLGLLLLCWLPVLIAFFPGIAGYDMDFQIYQVTSGNYSAHHPLLHTLFLGIFCWLGEALGSLTLGYGLHTLMQVALLAASISYALAWLAGIGCPRWLWIALLAYFALSPQHAVMACSGTKDILFAAAMLAITVELCRLLLEPQRRLRRWVLAGDAVLVAIACMLRNNAVYSFVLLIVISFLFFRRKLGKRVLAATLSGVISAQAGMIGLQAATGAASSSVREMLSIPCQQLARVYDRYGLSIPEGYEIIEVLPDAENYFPSRADFTKSSAKVTTSDRLVRFLKLWIREALHHPVEYLDAFLYNIRGFWYINDLSFATTYDEVEGSPVGCMSLGHHDNIGIAAPWLLPGLRTLWQQLFTLNGYQHFPILWTLLHPAFYSWLLGFVLVWAWYRRDRRIVCGFWACMLPSFSSDGSLRADSVSVLPDACRSGTARLSVCGQAGLYAGNAAIMAKRTLMRPF